MKPSLTSYRKWKEGSTISSAQWYSRVAVQYHRTDWITMGFCGCSDVLKEAELTLLYLKLFQCCTFDEFCSAYNNARLIELFRKKGLSDKVHLNPSVSVDYGFTNCKNAKGKRILKRAYKDYFLQQSRVDPLALHQAAIKGRLFEHVSQAINLNSQKVLERLMENPYPIPKLHRNTSTTTPHPLSHTFFVLFVLSASILALVLYL